HHANTAKAIYTKLNQQASSVSLEPPVANVIGIVFYEAEKSKPENILSAYYGALFFLNQKPEVSFKIFDSRQMNAASGFLGYVVQHTVSRFTSIGTMLDQSNQFAFTDPITGLPNARAAEIALEEAVAKAQRDRGHFSILIVDGDSLRQYNKFSFSGGDELIQRLGQTLRGEMRPTDYLARWRTGDQFFIILPESLPQAAAAVGERMRVAVDTQSKQWMIHSTISVGVAGCPQHGKSAQKVLDVAEKAVARAKEMGKNRVAIFS
ncbi:MAG: GGDEF domain-containing protein, partial [Anaerolineales bacterium]